MLMLQVFFYLDTICIFFFSSGSVIALKIEFLYESYAIMSLFTEGENLLIKCNQITWFKYAT